MEVTRQPALISLRTDFRHFHPLVLAPSAIQINKPYLTFAGQTAPGGGIQISGNKLTDPATGSGIFNINTHDVIIRYLRLRSGYVANITDKNSIISVYSGYSRRVE